MTTNPEDPLDGVESRINGAEHIARSVIAGHPQGAVRRIILYAMLGAALGAAPGLGLVAVAIGFLVFTLLIATDVLL